MIRTYSQSLFGWERDEILHALPLAPSNIYIHTYIHVVIIRID